ncbi:MAG TPA: hypothetical protein VKA55_02175 [Gammaproteobacteria bacterium]|nr:hypothetical protein [Gammaproteobacteria bacterium]
MPMRIDVRSRQDPERLLGYIDLPDNEIAPGTEELHLAGNSLRSGDGEVTVPVSFRKATPDVGKWIAWAEGPEELDGAEGYSHASSQPG